MNETADIVVTDRLCIKSGYGYYFRTFRYKPKKLKIGSRIFYIEDGFIRGFGAVSGILRGRMQCGPAKRGWNEGYHAIMQADSWKWIKPIPMKGFLGWRYFNAKKIKVVGGWTSSEP